MRDSMRIHEFGSHEFFFKKERNLSGRAGVYADSAGKNQDLSGHIQRHVKTMNFQQQIMILPFIVNKS